MGVNDRSIGFFCSSISWGGLEMNLLKYAQWLHERGWRVVLSTDARGARYAGGFPQAVTRRVVDLLRAKGRRVAVVRHPP